LGKKTQNPPKKPKTPINQSKCSDQVVDALSKRDQAVDATSKRDLAVDATSKRLPDPAVDATFNVAQAAVAPFRRHKCFSFEKHFGGG